jgi:hypothetical protein
MKIIFIFSILLLSICGHSQNKFEHLTVIQGSDKFEIRHETNRSIILDYPQFSVSVNTNHNNGGETILVCEIDKGDTIIYLKGGPIYFYGIYNDFLFLDEGTGNIRSMMIYHLKWQDFITSFKYEREPIIRSDSVFYDYPFNRTQNIDPELPKCPDSLIKSGQYGYCEKRIYLLLSKKSISTGNIKCEYQE